MKSPPLPFVGVLALVAYTVVWLRLFLPLSGLGLLLFGLSNLATLVLFSSFGLLVGKNRKRPYPATRYQAGQELPQQSL